MVKERKIFQFGKNIRKKEISTALMSLVPYKRKTSEVIFLYLFKSKKCRNIAKLHKTVNKQGIKTLPCSILLSMIQL